MNVATVAVSLHSTMICVQHVLILLFFALCCSALPPFLLLLSDMQIIYHRLNLPFRDDYMCKLRVPNRVHAEAQPYIHYMRQHSMQDRGVLQP